MDIKTSNKLIIGSVIVFVPFVIGLMGVTRGPGYMWIGLGYLYSAAVVLFLGVSAIVYFVKKIGIKGSLIGFFILLVLIPLVIFGTCLVTAAGAYINNLF